MLAASYIGSHPDRVERAAVESWDGRALFLSGNENTIIGSDWQRERTMPRFKRTAIRAFLGRP